MHHSYPHNASVQFMSVAKSCPTLCGPMNCSTPGLPVHHQLLESIQTDDPLLERYVSVLILVSKMAPTEAGKAARIPPTQSHGHSRCRRTTREEDGRKRRRECQEGSHRSGPHPHSPRRPALRHRKWGPHPLTSEAGRERCWGTGVSEGDGGERRACLRRGRKDAQVLAWGPPKTSPLVD